MNKSSLFATYPYYGSANTELHLEPAGSDGSEVRVSTDFNETIAVISSLSELEEIINKEYDDSPKTSSNEKTGGQRRNGMV